MEKELKTYKDLLEEGVINQEQYERGQAEAVKWVKSAWDVGECKFDNFIYFFNLTEEDLE